MYLDKFAVLDDAQGEGLGRAVWQEMREEMPRCSGARGTQLVNDFYFAESDGCYRFTDGRCSGTASTISMRSTAACEHCATPTGTLIDRNAVAGGRVTANESASSARAGIPARN